MSINGCTSFLTGFKNCIARYAAHEAAPAAGEKVVLGEGSGGGEQSGEVSKPAGYSGS